MKTEKTLQFTAVIYLVWLGGWTLAQNLGFILGQGLFVSLLLALGLWSGIVLLLQATSNPESRPEISTTSPSDWTRAHKLILAACFIGFTSAWVLRSMFGYWLTAAMVVTALILTELHTSAPAQKLTKIPLSAISRTETFVLLVLIIFAAGFGLLANLGDPDDSYYLSLAARAAEAPFAAFPTDHPTFPPGTAENRYPLFEVMSYPYFIGLSSWLLDAQPLVVVSYIFAVAGAAYIVVVYALLYRRLFPKQWLWVLSITVAILLIDGSFRRGPGNLAFATIWLGKSMLYHILRPLILLFSLEFGENPSRRGFLLLSLSNIAGVGLTPVSVWITPTLTGIGILSGSFSQRHFSLRSLAFGALSCFYPLSIGALFYLDEFNKYISITNYNFTWLQGLELTFLFPETAYFRWMLGFTLLFLFLAPTRRARALGLVTGLVGIGLFLNPLLGPTIAHYIVNERVYWRVIFIFLVVPSTSWVLYAFAEKLSGFLKNGQVLQKFKLGLLVGGIIALFAVLIPTTYIFSKDNQGIWFGPPYINVQKIKYEMLLNLYNQLEPGSVVLAPFDLSWMMPTMIGGSFPANHREDDFLHSSLDPGEYSPMLDIESVVNGEIPLDPREIQAVVVYGNTPFLGDLDNLLQSTGYSRNEFGYYIYWVYQEKGH